MDAEPRQVDAGCASGAGRWASDVNDAVLTALVAAGAAIGGGALTGVFALAAAKRQAAAAWAAGERQAAAAWEAGRQAAASWDAGQFQAVAQLDASRRTLTEQAAGSGPCISDTITHQLDSAGQVPCLAVVVRLLMPAPVPARGSRIPGSAGWGCPALGGAGWTR